MIWVHVIESLAEIKRNVWVQVGSEVAQVSGFTEFCSSWRVWLTVKDPCGIFSGLLPSLEGLMGNVRFPSTALVHNQCPAVWERGLLSRPQASDSCASVCAFLAPRPSMRGLFTQQWPQDWKRSVFIPIPKKGNAKECSNYCTIALISHASKGMLKILQARLQQ